jgi:signal transduction histidine kinase
MRAVASTMDRFFDQARDPAPARAIEPRPRLVLRFALYAGAVLLAAGLAIAWLVNREVALRAEHSVEAQARAVAERNLRSSLRPSDFTRQVSPARKAQLDRLFRGRILVGNVVGGRLVARDGRITYAVLHRFIGKRVPYTSELDEIFAGRFKRHLTHTETWRGEPDVEVLQALVPVRREASGKAIGALELDLDYRAAGGTLSAARTRLALILGLALLALYVSLFPILGRVTRELEARNRRLREHAEERGRLLEAERQARADAEAMQGLLAAQNERLLELDALKDEFISLVSHELRTPLTSIRGYLELLLEDRGLDGDQQRYLSIVDRNSERLLDLVSDLLFLAQVDAGKLAFDVRPLDLGEVVAECIETALPTATAQGIELAARTTPMPEVRGDRARLAQVLDNLVSNGLKFTPSGGRVEVRTSAVGDAAVIEVEDTGIGLARDEQEQLFERFYRSSRATEDAIPGTGLGLAIAKTIVERHGGRIEVESAPDAGTTVRVELPLSERERAQPPRDLAA